MRIFETVFDSSYLTAVIFMGIILISYENSGARLFGFMAMILGFGDLFHLVPRMIALWSEDGFRTNLMALSYGQLLTSITMAIFYLLFFYYIERMTGIKHGNLEILAWLLTLARIVLSLLPANGWGTENPSWEWGIIRNIPFLLMGILILYLLTRYRNTDSFSRLALLVTISFACYIPVVLLADRIPAIGALMMPKTVAYILMVVVTMRYFTSKENSGQLN